MQWLPELERFVSFTDGSNEVSLDSLQSQVTNLVHEAKLKQLKMTHPPKRVLRITAEECWAARLHGPHSTQLQATIQQFEVQLL